MMRSGFLSVQPTDEFGTHGAQTASSSELNPSPNPHIENNNNNTNHNPPTPQSHISNGVGGVVGGGGMVLHNSGVHNGAASAVESSAMGMYDNDLLQHLTDDDEKHHVIIGHIKTQWNEDFTLMQLLLYLFEMHTFGEASEVPEEVWEGVARAVFEVENVILNPLLTRWSSTEGIEALRQLVTRWREFGPGEQVYDTSRELLEKVVEPDIAGTVKPTIIRSLWKSLGASSRLPFLMWFYLVTTILAAAVCAAQAILAARNEGGTSLAQIVCAVCSAIVFLIAASVPMVGLTVAHHNAVMHGIVNFMEMRRFRDVLPASSSDTPDMGGSVLSAEDYIEHEHHLPSPNHHHNNTSSHATDHFGPAAFSFAGASTTKMNNNQNALPTQHNNIGGGPHSSVRTIGLSSSKRFLPRFEQFGGGSAIGNNLALVSHGLSFTNNNNANGAVGAHSASTNAAINNNNGGGGEGTFNTEREAPKAHILCVDNALVTSLCFPLWKCRVSVVCYTDIKEFASAALRVRHDRLRLLFIHESLVTESTYQMFKPLEDACPQQVTYFAQEETSSSETSGGNRSSVIPKNLIVYNISESDILRIVTLAQEQSMNVNATQDIMKHGKHFTIPQYTLGRRLGGGAFGNVFEAEMDALGGRCAVKRIYFKTGEATERLREIGREVDIMSRLQHPNIVQYLFCRREGNCVCIFMELCEGGSLSGQIQRRELTADLIKYFLRQIIEAVMYLHDKFIIHRDLKPENVLFRNGQVKLTDFGTAAKFQGADGQQRNIKGTFPFMAPEVLLEEPYGKQCDVWSIGCIAADMLGVVLDHRSLGLIELTRFFHDLSLMMAIEAESEEPNVKDFLERCFCRDPLRRPTPALLLQHTILRPEDGSIRRHLEQVPSRLGRRPSGAQSLRSQNIPGGANQTDNESEF